MMKRILLFTLVVICLQSGVLYAQESPGADAPVLVYLPKDPKPAQLYQLKELGTIKVRDGFRISCGLEETMEDAREKARKLGGNIVRVTKLIYPEVMSTCYRLEATVYHTDSLSAFGQFTAAKNDSVSQSLISDTASYALIYVYRNPMYFGSLAGYNIHVGDSVICRVRNNSKDTLRFYEKGKLTFWAKTETRVEETIDIQPGKVYFLRCEMKMGIVLGRPVFKFVPALLGYREYNTLVAGK